MNLKNIGVSLVLALAVSGIFADAAAATPAGIRHMKSEMLSSHDYVGNVVANAAAEGKSAGVPQDTQAKAGSATNACSSSGWALWLNNPNVRIVSWSYITVTGTFPSIAKAPVNPAVNMDYAPFQQAFLCTQGRANSVCDAADLKQVDAWSRFYCSVAPAADPEDISTYWNAIPQNSCAVQNLHTGCHATTQFKAQLLDDHGGPGRGSVRATLVVIEYTPQPCGECG